jgi:drug/metabolite transporter (DMT)-like permease
VFLQATAPLYIALLGPVLLGERFRRKDVPLLAAIIVGVLFLFARVAGTEAPGPWPLLGGALIIVAASVATWRDTRVPVVE